MAGRFPGAARRRRALAQPARRGGVDHLLHRRGAGRRRGRRRPAPRSRYVQAEGYLADVELFDAAFFGFSPREAEILDPQHRLFLECAWEALERRRLRPRTLPPARSASSPAPSISTYLLYNLLADPQLLDAVGGCQALIGNDKDFLATRVSYKLNLRGPEPHRADRLLDLAGRRPPGLPGACSAGECDMALAGGVSIARAAARRLPLRRRAASSRPTATAAPSTPTRQGTVFGNGVGVVVLKRLADALADGDHVHAVIRGSAVNNDGAAKVGFTAPSVDGQAEVIAAALAVAGVDPETIGYVEAHGTGTPLGDPIEIAALTQAFRARHRPRRLLRHRLGQDQHRPPGRGGRRRRADQDGAGAGAPARSRPACTSSGRTRRSTSRRARSSSTPRSRAWRARTARRAAPA